MIDKEKEIYEPVYLSDLAIEQLVEDEFKHSEVAKVLKQIAYVCPMPFTIGLFGSWGTGKTTIVNFLRTMLLEDKKVAVVVFDVWKFEKDPLRRQFLITVEEQLKKQNKLSNEFKLDKRLFCRISERFDSNIKFDFKRALKTCWIYILAIVTFFSIWFFSKNLLEAFGLSLFIAILLELLKAISQSIRVETTTFEQDRLSQSDEFEKQFDRIIDKTTGIDRLIIIVDNLDRSTHQKAIELLSTVKTFLEKRKCIYVVPCDAEAIKDHLRNVYEKIDPDEYLRKFFNTVINVPDFIRSDLDAYTEKLLMKTKIPQFSDSKTKISFIITTAYRENPRRIKQFINMLISHFLLAKERESGTSKTLYPKGVITENVSFLAKFLILRHNWPDFFKIIKEDPMILEEINLSYRDSKIQLPEKVKAILDKDSKLNDFLSGNQLITTKYPRAFLYLKQSEEEQKIPESEDIRANLLDGKQNFIEEKFKTIKGSKDVITAYEKIVLDLLEKNLDRPERLFNILNVSIKSSRNTNIAFDKNLYDKAIELVHSRLEKYFHRFDPEDIFLALERCSETLRGPIIDRCTELLTVSKESEADEFFGTLDLDKYQRSIIRQIAAHISWFNTKKLAIQKIIANTYSSDLDIIEYFCKDENLINFFISEHTISKIIAQIAESDVQEVKKDNQNGNIKLLQKIEIFKNCKNIMNTSLISSLVKQMAILLQSINPKPFSESKRQFLSIISDILVNFDISEINKDEMNNFSQQLNNGFNVAGSIQLKTEYIMPMILVVDKTAGSTQTNINNSISSFLNSTEPSLITKIISGLSSLNVKQYIEEKYKAIFFKRSAQAPEIFNVLWDNIRSALKDELFVSMMASPHYKVALDKIKAIGYKVEKVDVVAKAIVDKIPQIGNSEKPEFYAALVALNCGDSSEVLNGYIAQLKNDLTSNQIEQEQVGYDALREAKNSKVFSIEICKSIVNDLIDNLDKRENLNQNNTFALDAITFFWSDLSLTHKDKFVTLIVYKLFEKNSDTGVKKMGISKLVTCKPRYSEHKSHFDHLLSLIEQVSEADQRIQLATELLKCSPESASIKDKKEKKFWDKLQKLTSSSLSKSTE